MNQKGEIDPALWEKLQVLKTPAIRNPELEKSGRAKFLQEAKEMSAAVTPTMKQRLNKWTNSIQSIFVIRRKEHPAMLNTFATILIAAALVFGGGGVVVASAQSSQPDNLLYGIKLLSEDIQLQLTTNPETQYQISLDFVDRRAEEIRTMLEVDGIPPESVVVRYQNQVEQTIRYALNLPDEQTVEALEQVQLRLQTHEQSMLNIKTNASPKAETSLLQIQQMIQEQLRIVEGDLSDPTQLREQIRSQDQLREQDQTRTSIPEGQANQTESGTGNGNPWTTGIPTQNSGYGPGPGPEPACTCTPKLGENSNQQSGQPSLIGPQATLVPGGQGGKQ